MAEDSKPGAAAGPQFQRAAIALLVGALLVSVVAYFAVYGVAAIPSSIQQLLLDVIANLIPTIIVALIVVWILRKEVGAEQERAAGRLISQSEARILEEVRNTRLSLESRLPTEQGAGDLKPSAAEQVGINLSANFSDRDEDTAVCVGYLLHSLSLALLNGVAAEGTSFRMFCHLADADHTVLRPLCRWSERHTDDYNAGIPLNPPDSDPFVISRAFRERKIVAENLTDGHLGSYPLSLRTKILPSLKCVVAAPICDFEPISSEPLGTISIDCSTSRLEELGFGQDSFKESLIWCAKAVNRILVSRTIER